MNTLEGVTIIGLTGQSGAGKTTASAFFADCGIPVIDCDEVSRYVAGFPSFLDEVEAAFPGCVTDGKLERQKLASIVFNDQIKLRLYTDMIFPYITEEVYARIGRYKSAGIKLIILDAPTLFESGIDNICSAVISVTAPFEVKLRRVLERDNIPVDLVVSRISSQHNEEFFSERSDYMIVNNGDLSDLKKSVVDIAQDLKERFDA